jgi:hypothetical protein
MWRPATSLPYGVVATGVSLAGAPLLRWHPVREEDTQRRAHHHGGGRYRQTASKDGAGGGGWCSPLVGPAKGSCGGPLLPPIENLLVVG